MDGEVVAVNLKNGRYYSMSGCGTEIWNGITEGRAEAQLLQSLLEKHSGPREAIEVGLSAFLDELQREGLVAEVEGGASSEAVQEPADRTALPPFACPQLSSHADMEGLLLLDPIHDVSEEGWPQKKPD